MLVVVAMHMGDGIPLWAFMVMVLWYGGIVAGFFYGKLCSWDLLLLCFELEFIQGKIRYLAQKCRPLHCMISSIIMLVLR